MNWLVWIIIIFGVLITWTYIPFRIALLVGRLSANSRAKPNPTSTIQCGAAAMMAAASG